MICFNVGLPTKEKSHVWDCCFGNCSGLEYISESNQTEFQALLDDLISFSRTQDMGAKNEGVKKLSNQILELHEKKGKLIISCPAIAMSADEAWEGGLSVDYIQTFNFINRLKKSLAGRCGEVKVAIAIEEQSSWLMSIYKTAFEGQETLYGFEEKTLGLLENRAMMGPFRWLFYDRVLAAAEQRFEEKNVMMYSIESLQSDPKALIADLISFAECDELLVASDIAYDQVGIQDEDKGNLRKTSGNTSASAPRDALELRGWLKSEILECFESTNLRLNNKIKHVF